MLIIKNVKDMLKHLFGKKRGGKTVGFVPTMGALHQGHVSLIEFSCKKMDITVCSIFVNPTQFNDKVDFEKYPITIDRDIEKLVDAGCDILFLPGVKEVYPHGVERTGNLKKKSIDFGFLGKTLEGEYRPGHFLGMAQVVERLLRIVSPDTIYMGQKDYQQQLIVAELIKKRKFKAKLVVCPIVREADGLAMSSRNIRLDVRSRKVAVELSRVLESVKEEIRRLKSKDGRQQKRSLAQLLKIAITRLEKYKEFEIEYLEIRDAKTLQPIKLISPQTKAVALVAVKIGGVRLIDNVVLT